MKILMNTGGLAQTNCFLIADEATKQAVLFDAPDSTVLPLMGQARARGWEVVGLWLTHGHFDHIADHEVVTAGERARSPRPRPLGEDVPIESVSSPNAPGPARSSWTIRVRTGFPWTPSP